jgi:hypothetical protein
VGHPVPPIPESNGWAPGSNKRAGFVLVMCLGGAPFLSGIGGTWMAHLINYSIELIFLLIIALIFSLQK